MHRFFPRILFSALLFFAFCSHAGDKITLTVLRDGSRKRFTYPLNVLK